MDNDDDRVTRHTCGGWRLIGQPCTTCGPDAWDLESEATTQDPPTKEMQMSEGTPEQTETKTTKVEQTTETSQPAEAPDNASDD